MVFVVAAVAAAAVIVTTMTSIAPSDLRYHRNRSHRFSRTELGFRLAFGPARHHYCISSSMPQMCRHFFFESMAHDRRIAGTLVMMT